MNEVETLTAQMEANKACRQRRKDANDKDWEEYCRLDQQLKRATAKTLIGSLVVLNPNSSISNPVLRKLRGMPATVESIGRKYAHVKFENGEAWRIGFDRIVPATPANSADSTGGQMADSIADSLNGALARM